MSDLQEQVWASFRKSPGTITIARAESLTWMTHKHGKDTCDSRWMIKGIFTSFLAATYLYG